MMPDFFWSCTLADNGLSRGGSTGRGGAIIKIQFAREISDGMLWNV